MSKMKLLNRALQRAGLISLAKAKEMASPTMTEVIQGRFEDRYRTYPTASLTPENLVSYLRNADRGLVGKQLDMLEEIEEKDGHILSVLQTRKLAVANKDWSVIPISKEDKDRGMAEWTEQKIKGIVHFRVALQELMDAVSKGWSMSEIMWGVKRTENVVSELKFRPQWKFTFAESGEDFEIVQPNPPNIPIPDNKFIIHRYRAKSGFLGSSALGRTLLWLYLCKHSGMKYWLMFMEKFGMPLVEGIYKSTASREDKDVLLEAAEGFITDAYCVHSDQTEFMLTEANRGSSSDVYSAWQNFIDESISLVVLGQTASTKGTPGKLGSEQERSKVRQDIVAADCMALQETISQDLIRPLIVYNYGEQEVYPDFFLHYAPAEDLERLSKVHKTVFVDMGLPVAKQFLYEKYGVPKPEEGEEDLLEPPKKGGLGNFKWQASLDQEGVVQNVVDRLLEKGYIVSPEDKAAKPPELVRDNKSVRAEWAEADKVENAAIKEGIGDWQPLRNYLRKKIKKANSYEDLQGWLAPLTADVQLVKSFGQTVFERLKESDALGRKHALDQMVEIMKEKSDELIVLQEAAGISWEIVPEEALKWMELQGFTIAHIESLALRDHVKAKVLKAIQEGMYLGDFKAQVNDVFKSFGIDPLSPHRIENIFRTNLSGAYNSGRYVQFNQPGLEEVFPYYQFHNPHDDRSTDDCYALSGAIYPRDDPIWDTWWPPNHFRCRSSVSAISVYEMEGRKLKETKEKFDLQPAKGFRHNPATRGKEDFMQWARDNGVPDMDEIGGMYGL